MTVILDGDSLHVEELARLAAPPVQPGVPRATIPARAWARVDSSRRVVEHLDASETAYYGINTGFGPMCRIRVPATALAELQRNLIESHAVGVGPALPDPVVRLMIAIKINSLVKGHSGVRPETIHALQALLDHDVLPIVPSQGSVGASGDLAPLAHLSRALLGEGMVRHAGVLKPAAEALATIGLPPLEPAAKEGLALLNGTQLMSAIGALVALRGGRLARMADAIAACSIDALKGSVRPFDARVAAVRPHHGVATVCANIRRMMEGSEILVSHAGCGKVQDPYSLRCVPQVHGASRDAIDYLRRTIDVEINSATDNPLLFSDAGDVLSAGNFHGQPLALALDFAAMALAEWASISERRAYFLLEGHDGLPRLLLRDSGLNSGFMIVQYTSAALVSENKVLCHPACVDSVPTALGQEDHVSMGSVSALKSLRVLENAERVLAIELLMTAQALDFRLEEGLSGGIGVRALHRLVRSVAQPIVTDRFFGDDIEAATELVRSGRLLETLQEADCALD